MKELNRMGHINPPPPVKLFCGLLQAATFPADLVRARLEAAFGPIDSGFGPLDFTYTRYYEPEMGPRIVRRFYGFHRLISPDQLPGIKIRTNDLEEELAPLVESGSARPVNLDPGYLEQAKVILASTKNFFHRLYLGGGIWGEVTLHFRRNAWQSFSWTFPDYASGDYDPFFSDLRRIYREQLAQRPTDPD